MFTIYSLRALMQTACARGPPPPIHPSPYSRSVAQGDLIAIIILCKTRRRESEWRVRTTRISNSMGTRTHTHTHSQLRVVVGLGVECSTTMSVCGNCVRSGQRRRRPVDSTSWTYFKREHAECDPLRTTVPYSAWYAYTKYAGISLVVNLLSSSIVCIAQRCAFCIETHSTTFSIFKTIQSDPDASATGGMRNSENDTRYA